VRIQSAKGVQYQSKRERGSVSLEKFPSEAKKIASVKIVIGGEQSMHRASLVNLSLESRFKRCISLAAGCG